MSTRLDQINALSEQNSKETIDALLELLKDETLTEEELVAAEEAFETVSFLYALPQTEEEERDVKICSLIAKRLDYLQDLAFDFHIEEQNLEEAKLESEIALELLNRSEGEQKEDRQVDAEAAEILAEQAVDACAQIEQEIAHTNAWIDCAHEMLTTEKYQTLPEECFEVLFPADEDEDLEEGDGCEDDDCCGEGCDEGCEDDNCGGCEQEGEEDGGCCGNGGCCK